MKNKILLCSLLLSCLSLSASESKKDWFVDIAKEKFDGAIGPVSNGVTNFPKKDTVFTGTSLTIGKKFYDYKLPYVLVAETGQLNGEYDYLNVNHNADVSYVAVGARLYLLPKEETIQPFAGLDYGIGSVSIPTLNLYYDFYFPGLVAGADIKLTEKIDLSLILQYASNDGATYTRYKYGLSYSF